MTEWTKQELDKIGAAEELHIASLRGDGTLRDPVIIWVVRIDDDLYVRAVKGRSGWFRGVLTRHEGHIRAGGIDKDVAFAEVSDPDVNDRIDAEYRAKYHRYAASIIDHVIAADARSATIRLVPR